LEQFLIYSNSNSGDSKDGDCGNSGINDSFIISNSEAKPAYEYASKIVLYLRVTTCVLFPRSHRVTGIVLCKKTQGRDYANNYWNQRKWQLCVTCEVTYMLFGSSTGTPILIRIKILQLLKFS